MTCRIIHDGKDRNAWRQARDIGVGASEVPILFGCGYGDSAELRLFAQKTGVEVAPTSVDEGMTLGQRLEPAILDETCARAGLSVGEYERNIALIGNTEALPFAVCTPDGMTTAGEPIEVKNICHRIEDEEWEDGIPMRYRLQVQTQLAITEAKRALFGALIFGGRIVWDWIPRDEKLIAEIRNRVDEFWGCVIRNDHPPSNGTRDARNAAYMIAEKLPPVELFESDIGSLLLDINLAKEAATKANAEAKKAKEFRDSLEDELMLKMGSAQEAITHYGVKVIKTTTHRKPSTTKASTSHGIKIIDTTGLKP